MSYSELASEDVRDLVFQAIKLIREVRDERGLPICLKIEETQEMFAQGTFKAEEIPYEKRANSFYALNYSYFEPPLTIGLDRRRPFWDKPLDLPKMIETATFFCVVHEVIHADDYRDGDQVIKETIKHIERAHQDKLKISIDFLKRNGAPDFLKRKKTLTSIWARQYSDMITHYRTYLILRHRHFPKIEYLWSCLYNDYFPPNIFTIIEREKGINYVIKRITEDLGNYCLIEALGEAEEISKKNAYKYTV